MTVLSVVKLQQCHFGGESSATKRVRACLCRNIFYFKIFLLFLYCSKESVYPLYCEQRTSFGGGIGRHAGLKIPWPAMAVRVRFPSEAHESLLEAILRGIFVLCSGLAQTSGIFAMNIRMNYEKQENSRRN